MTDSKHHLPEELEAELVKKIQAVHEGIGKAWAIPYTLPELLQTLREVYLQTVERTVLAEHCLEKQIPWSAYIELRERMSARHKRTDMR